nr:hypothetical protein [Tanacetum cinerariifolium]
YVAVATSCCSAFNLHTLPMTIYYWKLDNKQVTIQFRVFISAGVLFLLLEYSVPVVRSSLLLLASVYCC